MSPLHTVSCLPTGTLPGKGSHHQRVTQWRKRLEPRRGGPGVSPASAVYLLSDLERVLPLPESPFPYSPPGSNRLHRTASRGSVQGRLSQGLTPRREAGKSHQVGLGGAAVTRQPCILRGSNTIASLPAEFSGSSFGSAISIHGFPSQHGRGVRSEGSTPAFMCFGSEKPLVTSAHSPLAGMSVWLC